MHFRAHMGAALAAALIGSPAAAGPHAAPSRDLTGLWSTASLTELERPDDFKTLAVSAADAAKFETAHRGKVPEFPPGENTVGGAESEWWETDSGLARIRGQIRTSWIVSPADGQRPFTAAAKAARKVAHDKSKVAFDGPEDRDQEERCIAPGAGAPLLNGGYNDNLQFVQTKDRLAIYAEWMGDMRIVRLDGSGHPPAAVRVAGGDSIGHWDGATLVVETTNFPPAEVLAANGDQTADMRIVERFTRTAPTEIAYSFSVTNPSRFLQTWQAEMVLHPANGRIFEYACHEGNYGLANILAAARRLEGRTVDGVAAR